MRIEVENIGGSKGWIALITGTDPKFGFARQFVGDRDYSRANKPRTRGVYTIAEVPDGSIIEVNSPEAWGRTERYFAVVEAGNVRTIDALEVRRLLDGQSDDFSNPIMTKEEAESWERAKTEKRAERAAGKYLDPNPQVGDCEDVS